VTTSLPDLRQSPAEEVIFFPASFAQQRLWFIDQLTPGAATYNVPIALRVCGDLDVEMLQNAVVEIVRRHETFRTRFISLRGEPQQVIEKRVKVELPVLDLTTIVGEQQREAEAMRVALEEAQQPFNLQQAPLMRGKLLRLSVKEHVLLFTMHHIISDAWSVGVLVEEVTALYEAFSAGKSSPLPELPIQYADYSVWQRDCMERGLLDPQLEYWKRQLAGVSMLQLPTDHRRPVLLSQNGATCNFVVPANLTQKLKKLAEEQNASLFMVLLAAFQTLLYRYSGQHDIAVGTPIAGRNSSATEKLIGFLINTIVLRMDLSGAPPFTELLQKAKNVTLEAFAHQDVPFEKLVEVLSPERNMGSTPLFQVMIVVQNAPSSDLRLGTAALLPFADVDNGTSKFDLLLQHAEDGYGKLTGSLQYSTDLFEAATVRRMINHYLMLLSGIAAIPAQSIAALPLLTASERHQAIEEWNRTEQAYPQYCVPELFEIQAGKTPNAVAVEFDGQRLTYAELDRLSNQLARYLNKNGVRPDGCVAISLQRSLDMVVGVLAILKSGAAYVPLDPQYPQSRLSYMLENSAVELLLTQKQFLGSFSGLAKSIVCLDVCRHEVSEQSAEKLAVHVDAANLAYVIYTSGSTGKPKGVAMVHGALANLLNWQISRAGQQKGRRTLQFTSLSFDVSFQEIFATWCAGGSLILVDEDTRRDPVLLWQAIQTGRVERLFLPFVALQQLAEIAQSSTDQNRHLREVITAGEQLKTTPDLQKFFSDVSRSLENQYGPSETHVVTAYHLEQSSSQWSPLPPIGTAIANTQVYVLDALLEPTPVGIAGQLYLGGTSLARGYMNRPDWTADRFVPDPFSTQLGARLYRTGDLVRYRADGNLEFLGRMDQQVKVRGFRIELGEIEAALQDLDGVQQAAVTAWADETGNKRLVAYISSVAGQQVSVGELREKLKLRLPDYMVPASFVLLEALPLTATGKVDRKALPAPDNSAVHDVYVAPSTPVEQKLAEIWSQLLKVERVGVNDDFFALGGHSLLATQVRSRMRAVFGVDAPLRHLFENPTIAGLAKVVCRLVETNAKPDAPPVRRVSRDRKLPLSFAQQRLWFLDQLEPGNRVYHIPTTVRLKGVLNLEVLSAAVDEIVQRHEILRTIFPATDGHPYQVVLPPAHVPIEKVDLRNVPQEFREGNLRKLADLHIQKPFDLAHGPLFRVVLYLMEEQQHVLCVAVHHIIYDAWSGPIYIRELNTLYNAFISGKASPLPELPVQYADVAVWEREWLRGEVLENHIQYWRQALEGAPHILNLPTDFPRPDVQSFDSEMRILRLSPELSLGLKKLSQHLGVTQFMTLLALMNVWLFRYSGQSDILVGTPVSNRNQIETEALIGFFLNTLVFRTRINAEGQFTQLVEQVRNNVLGGYTHQALPFEKLVEELHVIREPGRNPLFQVMFNMLTEVTDRLELAGSIETEGVQLTSGQVRFDIHLNAFPTPAGLEFAVTYNSALFQPSTITSMLETFAELVRAIVENPELTIAELLEKAVRFEQESEIARKRGHSQQQGQQLRTVRRRAALNESR
jgi:amino acid adenylation domain-containing protein